MAHRRLCKASAIFSILVLLFFSISVVSCDIQFTRGTAIQEVFEDELVNDDVSLHPTESSTVTIKLVPDTSVPETIETYIVKFYRNDEEVKSVEVPPIGPLSFVLTDLPRASYRIVGRAITEDGVPVAVGEASIKVSSKGADATIELKDVGHIMKPHPRVEATCTASGNIAYWHCTRCGLDFTDEEGLNHVSDTTIPAKGHSIVHVDAQEATCIDEGNIEYWHCDRCEKDFVDEEGSCELFDVAVSALGHDWSTDWSHDEHRHWHICTRCSATGDVADHAMVEKSRIDPTDEAEGSATYECDVCGYEHVEVLPALGHDCKLVESVPSTCTEHGYELYGCIHEGCTYTYRKELPLLKHSTTHEKAVAATCTENGNKEYWYCSTCGFYYSNEACSERFEDKDKTVIAALGHNWPTTWEKDLNKHWHVCTRPGCSAVQEEEHTYGCKVESADFIASSATCESPAIYHYSCICGAKGSGTFTVGEPLGHEYPLVEHEETESTCTIKGNIHYWECSRCNAKFSDGEGLHQIPESESVYKNLKDHVFTDDKHPSETYRGDENGHRHVCLTCNQPIGEVQNHMEGWSFNKQFHWRACSVCDYRIGSSQEHSFVPTSDGRRCSECPYSEKDEDPRFDSGFDVGVETNDPKCRLDVVDNGDHSHTFTCTNLIGGDSITEIRWYVDNVRLDIQTTQNSIEVATPERRSYRVFCIYSNGKGYGSCEAVVTGY